jgi:hypothetical protein
MQNVWEGREICTEIMWVNLEEGDKLKDPVEIKVYY